MRVWNIQKGIMLRVLCGHTASVRCLDIYGNKVVSGSYDTTCRVSIVSRLRRAFYSLLFTPCRSGMSTLGNACKCSEVTGIRSTLLQLIGISLHRGGWTLLLDCGTQPQGNQCDAFAKQLPIHPSFAGIALPNYQATQPSFASYSYLVPLACLRRAARTGA